VGLVLRELSVTEQRYQAVLAVIEDGLSVTEAAAKAGVSRQTLHSWLRRDGGLIGCVTGWSGRGLTRCQADLGARSSGNRWSQAANIHTQFLTADLADEVHLALHLLRR
jgi:Homeodomain-like domain-containing protein